jgi:hypothetical protein
MDAEQRVAEALARRGVTDAELDAALAAAEPALPRDEHDERDFYLAALALFVGSLGGELESGSDGLRAVFVDGTVGVDLSDD